MTFRSRKSTATEVMRKSCVFKEDSVEHGIILMFGFIVLACCFMIINVFIFMGISLFDITYVADHSKIDYEFMTTGINLATALTVVLSFVAPIQLIISKYLHHLEGHL